MKAVIAFLVVVILGFGFIQFIDWLGSEPPTHVYQVTPDGKAKLK